MKMNDLISMIDEAAVTASVHGIELKDIEVRLQGPYGDIYEIEKVSYNSVARCILLIEESEEDDEEEYDPEG
jgi:hypothetical protein